MTGNLNSGRRRTTSSRVREAQQDLDAALDSDETPNCLDDERFTRSRSRPLQGAEKRELYMMCFECPIFEACAEYAAATKPSAGYWAGKNYGTWERKS